MMLKPKEVEFLVGHEVLHVVYDHMGRRDNRDPEIWNIADDYAVNADLKRHKVGQFITSVPCLYETKYDGKAAEAIYDDLMKNVQKQNHKDVSLNMMVALAQRIQDGNLKQQHLGSIHNKLLRLLVLLILPLSHNVSHCSVYTHSLMVPT